MEGLGLERRVVFKAKGGREQSVPVEDAKHIHGHLVERSEPSTDLRNEIKRAIREDGVAVVEEKTRVELVRVLEAIEGLGKLTPDERALRDVFKEWIRTTVPLTRGSRLL